MKYLIFNIIMIFSLMAEEITSYVDRAVVSPDSSMMAVTSYADKTHSISLWDVNQSSFTMVKKFDFDDDTFFSENVVFSHDNKYLVMGVGNHTYVWDTKTYKLLHKLPNYYEVSAVQFSHDDKYLIVGGENYRVSIWNVKKGFAFSKQLEGKSLGFMEKLFSKASSSKCIYNISFSIDDNYLAVTFEDKAAQIYDMRNNFKMIKRFENKKDYIYMFHFSNDKKYLMASRNDVEMEFFEPFPPFKKLKTVNNSDNDDDIYMTAISKNSHYYLSSWDYNGYIKVWDIQDKVKKIATLDGHQEYTTELQFYNDDQYIISAGGDNKIKIWEFGTWKKLVEIHLDEKHHFKVTKY